MNKIFNAFLNFKYKNHTVFEGVTIEIDEGDIVLVIGRNGVGKSTLLKLMAGIIESNKYSICNYKYSLKQISYMPSDLTYYPNMRVKDLINFYQDVHKDFDVNYAFSYVNEFKIEETKKINKLSDGERKIIAYIITLSFNRKLYIIDEPFPNVDLLNDELFRKMIIEKYNEETTFIIATHQINEFEKVANKCLFIKNKNDIEILNTDTIRQEMNVSIEDYFKEKLKCSE